LRRAPSRRNQMAAVSPQQMSTVVYESRVSSRFKGVSIEGRRPASSHSRPPTAPARADLKAVKGGGCWRRSEARWTSGRSTFDGVDVLALKPPKVRRGDRPCVRRAALFGHLNPPNIFWPPPPCIGTETRVMPLITRCLNCPGLADVTNAKAGIPLGGASSRCCDSRRAFDDLKPRLYCSMNPV